MTGKPELSSTPPEDASLPAEERNATVATYGDLSHAEDAVRALEHAGFDMSHLSIIAKGMNTERHVIGFDTRAHREGHWARWGGLWGVLFGSFLFIPGVGHVAFGGYLLYLLTTGAIGAGTGAIGAALSSVGIPDDAVIRYETAIKADKQLLIAHGTRIDVERAREVLVGTAAESVEVHVGEADPVAP
jgi:uncharacterized membrane protein